MAKVNPKFPVTSGEKLQYMTHTMNDSSTRFVLAYPGRLDIRILRRAMRYLIDRVFVLHSSFVPADIPYWEVNDGYTSADTVKLLSLAPDADVLAAAEQEALRPVYFEDTLQLYCVLADNGRESALALVISHLIADGGDGKYILKKLVELYNCLLSNGEPDEVEIKNGDRDLLQVFDNVDPDVLENTADTSAVENAGKSSVSFPFPEPDASGSPRILRRTIGEDALAPARKKAKGMGATVNDLLLTAYYRAAVRLIGMGQDAPVSIMSMLDLRQYMENGQSEGICNLSSPLSTSLPNGIGDSFEETLLNISAQTKAIKGNGMAGLHNMDKGRFVVKGVFSLPFRLLAFAGRVGTRSMPMGMTNLGNMTRAELTMGSISPDFVYFAGQIKKKPGIQLAVMSLDGSPTMTISNVCGDQDELLLHKLLALVEEEIDAYGKEK